MKSKILQQTIIMIALTIAQLSNMLHCQELIAKFPYSSERALARVKPNYPSDVLIYNHASQKGNCFFLVNLVYPATALQKELSNTDMEILDFEIFDGVVYFCGKTNETDPHALFGYFPITLFPDGDVYIDTLPELMEFGKIDVFSAGGMVHAVMTAKFSSVSYRMVDAINITANTWQYVIAKQNDWTISFDDVAVTDSLVVFSSSSIMGKYGKTYIWYFPRPTALGASVFSNTYGINVVEVDNNSCSPVYVTHAQYNRFETACNSGDDKVTIDSYNGSNYNHSTLINRNRADTVVDIRYDKGINHAIVPIVKHGTTYTNTDVWSVAPYMWVPVLTCCKHLANRIVNSVDIIYAYNLIVGAGHTYVYQDLGLYEFDMFHANGCIPSEQNTPPTHTFEKYSYKRDLDVNMLSHTFRRMDYTFLTTNTVIECESELRNE